MLFQKETSITNWVNNIHTDDLLATCIGCTRDKVPSLGAHYDFMSRLWLSDLSSDRIKLKKLHSFKKKPSKTKVPGKNKKLPNKHPDIVKKIADYFYNDRSFARRAENLLQKIFALVAIKPSFDLNLIQQENLTISGDGTCVHCHSSYYGTKVCTCRENNIHDCKCDCKLADVDATWGWGSHENCWCSIPFMLYLATIKNTR